ncbi:hypothetical protein OEZ85_000149 [Tetradesmus obliquus]|uniref:Integral membrane bound transporter domain-containing protein n=1 Tax=Tetradesmus obliquus TaxID=3088 RepID=A0ABY8USS6_TETOB|nr:hypothetical protein OEZ85_000149 [Tetradesmus obliquus]
MASWLCCQPGSAPLHCSLPSSTQVKDASRTALGVLILSSLSFHVYRMHWSSAVVESHFAEALQWSAITVVLVSAPVVGRVARTGLERILGTILGPTVAYLACLAAAPVL